MIYKHICLMVVGLGCSLLAKAQDKQQTTITYNLAAETAIGTGDFTAFQLTSNRHDILATRSNTGYMRGAVNVEHSLGNDLILSGAVDFIGSSHANHKAYLQQCYANRPYATICSPLVRLLKVPTQNHSFSFISEQTDSGQFRLPKIGFR